MLEYAKEKPDDIEEVKFYADMHGNLKVVLNLSPVHCKSVFDLQIESDIGRLLLQFLGGNEDYKNLAIWQCIYVIVIFIGMIIVITESAMILMFLMAWLYP